MDLTGRINIILALFREQFTEGAFAAPKFAGDSYEHPFPLQNKKRADDVPQRLDAAAEKQISSAQPNRRACWLRRIKPRNLCSPLYAAYSMQLTPRSLIYTAHSTQLNPRSLIYATRSSQGAFRGQSYLYPFSTALELPRRERLHFLKRLTKLTAKRRNLLKTVRQCLNAFEFGSKRKQELQNYVTSQTTKLPKEHI
jgi:hypothetical protein